MFCVNLCHLFPPLRSGPSQPPLHLPPLSDHLALTSALIVNEISLSLLKFLRLILLCLLPLLILSPLNNIPSPPLLRETRIPAFLSPSPISSLSFPFSLSPHPYFNLLVCNHMHRRRGRGGGRRRGGGLGQHLPKAPQPGSMSGLKFI